MSIKDDMQCILMLLGEDILPPGASPTLTGANTAQIASSIPDVSMGADSRLNTPTSEFTEEGSEYSDLELKLTKRYLELIGGAERARDIIDKCDECMECLGLVDDATDISTIENVAEFMPNDVDLPTNNKMELATLYNPNSVTGPFNR